MRTLALAILLAPHYGITNDKVHIRVLDDIGSMSRRVAHPDEIMKILGGPTNGFYRIRTRSHETGYIFSAYVDRIPDYHRDEWWFGGWPDDDGDCQDARQEVLIRQSETPVMFEGQKHCVVKSGNWTCPYTGERFTDPHDLEIDHLVPLVEAHRAGGWAWGQDRRDLYVADLGTVSHLLAVSAVANRQKGDRTPLGWLPSSHAFRCRYVAMWREIKLRWGLTMSVPEEEAIWSVEVQCAGNP
jgi:hypothetical protein